jgi:hypothetical protein
VLGIAHRSSNTIDLPTDGFQGMVRLSYSLSTNLRLVGGASLTRFADQDLTVPFYCPIDGNCTKARSRIAWAAATGSIIMGRICRTSLTGIRRCGG